MFPDLQTMFSGLAALSAAENWLLAGIAVLEAFALTGLVVPGTLLLVLGGMLVRIGVVFYLDAAVFIALGTLLGSALSFALGRWARAGMRAAQRLGAFAPAVTAQALVDRFGQGAFLLGRFMGPSSGFLPYIAARSGRSRLGVWAAIVLGAVIYALIVPALGYMLASGLFGIGAIAPLAVGFGLLVVMVLGILWLTLVRWRHAGPLVVAIVAALLARARRHRAVTGASARFPRLTAFLQHRFDRDRFTGLTTTVLVGLFIYIFAVYLDSVYDFLGDGLVVQLDTRLANLFFARRDESLVALLAFVTALGSWRFVVLYLLCTSLALVLQRRWHLFTGLWVAAIGNQATVALLKSFFGRERSVLGYFTETSQSFPSGHAAASVAIWGMLFYIAWRTRVMSAATAAMAGVTLAFLIGVSRIYLVEHYLSDVMNGYFVGAMWLVIAIAVSEWWRHTHPPASTPLSPRRLALSYGGLAVAAIGTVALMAVLAPERNPAPQPGGDILIATPAATWTSDQLALQTETLLGQSYQPVSLILAAKDRDSLVQRMTVAGWPVAQNSDLDRLGREVWGALAGKSGHLSAAVPIFWNDRPSDMRFAPTAADGMGGGADMRVWETTLRTDKGRRIFVAVVSGEPNAQGVRARLLDAFERSALPSDDVQITAPTSPDKPVIVILP